MDPADDPRDTGTELSDERTILVDYLRVYRLTMEMKCAGLDAEQLARRSVPPSTMSLLGLMRHLADVERHWFRRVWRAGRAAAVLDPGRGQTPITGASRGSCGGRRGVGRLARRGRLRGALRRGSGPGDPGTMPDGKTIPSARCWCT